MSDQFTAAQELFNAMKDLIQSGTSLNYDFSCIGYRPMTEDGLPAIGRPDGIAGLYIAMMHSGVTLAPLIGRSVCEEIMAGRRCGTLEPYGLQRFG
jgi:glycine/D-amino acid oxidase-like deaminating enzyme